MSNTVFKRLFEVQFLHDYFLTSADGTSFFAGNQAEKKDLILKKLSHRIYDTKDLFEIEPTEATQVRMREYRLTMARTALGFLIGVEVVTETQAGELVYKPALAVDSNVHLTFSIRPKLPFFSAISNLSLRHPLPARYYFTNKDKPVFNEPTVPPHTSLPLTAPAPAPQTGQNYEMGALVNFAGTHREAIQYTDGTDATHWEDIDDKRYITDADKILLPHDFNYAIDRAAGITQVELVLEDAASVVIKTITKTSVDPLESLMVNLSVVDESLEDSPRIDDGLYTLKIKENGGTELIYAVYLSDEMYDPYSLGVVDIRFDELASPFSLTDAAGFLKTRINAANEKVPHPIFELRFKNRRTYWRYRTEGDFSPGDIATTAPHLDHQPGQLISKKPKGLTETLVPFLNGVALTLPHPKIPSFKVEEPKMFSEIFINQSNRLLNS